jgi:hypothetical protein
MHGDEKKAKFAGCTGYLAKPIDTRSFLNVIGGFLGHNPGGDKKC